MSTAAKCIASLAGTGWNIMTTATPAGTRRVSAGAMNESKGLLIFGRFGARLNYGGTIMKTKNTSRKEVRYNKPVGIIDGVLYLVNYTFEDTLHGNIFQGVTGSMLEPVTQGQIDEANVPENAEEYYREIWQECVKAGSTEESLEDFAQKCLSEQDSEFPGQDLSDVGHISEEIRSTYFRDAATFTCVGGGRCFTKNMKWDVILDQHLVGEINRLEDAREVK